MTETTEHQSAAEEDVLKTSLLALILSAFAAAFGVQSDKNRRRDFQQKSIVPFILAGVGLTAFFLLSLVLLVSWVLS